MEQILLDTVKIYGPLGLGWPLLIYVFLKCQRQNDKYIRLLIETINENTASLNQLIAKIKNGPG